MKPATYQNCVCASRVLTAQDYTCSARRVHTTIIPTDQHELVMAINTNSSDPQRYPLTACGRNTTQPVSRLCGHNGAEGIPPHHARYKQVASEN